MNERNYTWKELLMRLFQDFLLPLFIIFGLALFTGCGRKLESRWFDRQVTIDGDDGEWHGARVIVEEASVGIGLLNDDRDFYLTLSLSDPTVLGQILRRGFTVWLDPRGGEKQTFGLRFPLGLQAAGVPRAEGEEPTAGEPPPSDFGRNLPPAAMGRGRRGARGQMDARQLQAMFDRLTTLPELELLGPGQGQTRRLRLGELEDVEVAVAYTRGRLVYELRVPFATLARFDAKRGETIGLGFETPEIDVAAMRQQMAARGGGMRGGGMEGGMRGGGMPGGGMRGGMTTPERLHFWTKVKLASKEE